MDSLINRLLRGPDDVRLTADEVTRLRAYLEVCKYEPPNLGEGLPPAFAVAMRSEWRRDLLKLTTILLRQERQDAAPSGPVYRGNAVVMVAGERIALTPNEQETLECLLDSGGAANLSSIKSRTSVGEPNKVLRNMRRKYAYLSAHIHMACRNARGGYSTTIVDGRPSGS
jgi:hypothetical protein